MPQQLNVVELGRRRRWSKDEKLRIVMESRTPTARAAETAIAISGEA